MLDNKSLLSKEIMNTVIPRDFQFLDIKYFGRSDSLVHVKRFNDMTRVQGLTQDQRCRVFPLTLDGNAQKWYRRLPRGSIKTFEQMCRKFAEQFREVVAL